MLPNRQFLLVASLAALAARSPGPPSADAAELRMSSGPRVICRTVSHEAWSGAPTDLELAGVELQDSPDAEWVGPPSRPTDRELVPVRRAGIGFPPPRNAWRADAEYLLWWRKGRWFPPLVTVSDPGTPSSESGILGYSSTHVAFGGRAVGDTPEGGGRISLARWLDGRQWTGVAARFFSVNDATVVFSLDSSMQPNIARPFVDAQTGQPFALDISYFGESDESRGAIQILSDSDVLGGDVYFRWLWLATPTARLDWLAGYQFARIDENLVISSTSTTLEDGMRADVRDVFWTRNEFHGGNIGLLFESRAAPWRLSVLAKVALGAMHQRVAIRGATTFTGGQGGAAPPTNSGLLAQEATNSGHYGRNPFAVSPELVISLSRRLTDRWDFVAGYSLLYWSRVVQPGNAIDTTVDRRLLGGAGGLDPAAERPEFVFRDTDYWLQGLHFGLSCWF